MERSYRQYCGLARTLDLVGDRWTLLVVRELLPGPRRHRDLTASIGGIASNLLSDRLRRLEAGGVVERRLGADGAVVYALTAWGAELRTPIEALVRWGAPLMVPGPRTDDGFDPRWLAVALPALLGDARSTPPVVVGLEVDGALLVVTVDGDGARVEVATDPERRPATVVAGGPHALLGLAVGALGLDHPGLTVHGDPAVAARIFTGAGVGAGA